MKKLDSEQCFWLSEALAVALAREEAFVNEGDQWTLEFWVLISKLRDLPTDLLTDLTAHATELVELHEHALLESEEAEKRRQQGHLLLFAKADDDRIH